MSCDVTRMIGSRDVTRIDNRQTVDGDPPSVDVSHVDVRQLLGEVQTLLNLTIGHPNDVQLDGGSRFVLHHQELVVPVQQFERLFGHLPKTSGDGVVSTVKPFLIEQFQNEQVVAAVEKRNCKGDVSGFHFNRLRRFDRVVRQARLSEDHVGSVGVFDGAIEEVFG